MSKRIQRQAIASTIEVAVKEQTIPYPVRIPKRQLAVLRKHNIDIPAYVRGAIAELVSSLSRKK